MQIPELVQHALDEGKELSEKEEISLRLEIANLEGKLAGARASLRKHEEALVFIEKFQAAP